MTAKTVHKAPDHLREPTRAWWESVMRDYVLEPHHVRLLTLAGEAWDRACESREALAKHGLTFIDRYDQPRLRPEFQAERDSRTSFCRCLRELGLDVAPPEGARPPAAAANANRRKGR